MGLAHDMREHIQPAAMRHAEHDLLDAERAAALDDLLERRDHRFAAIQPEALGAGEFHVAEFLEDFSLDELVEDRALALAGEADLFVGAFDTLLNPVLLRAVGDVHELDAERLAIGAAQNGDDLADRAEFEAQHLIEENRPVEIGLVEAIGRRFQLLLVTRRLQPERIEMGVEMAARAIGADEHERADRIAGGALDVGAGNSRPLVWAFALTFSPSALPTSVQSPSSAATSSLRSGSGQSGRRHEGPRAFSLTSRGSSFRL